MYEWCVHADGSRGSVQTKCGHPVTGPIPLSDAIALARLHNVALHRTQRRFCDAIAGADIPERVVMGIVRAVSDDEIAQIDPHDDLTAPPARCRRQSPFRNRLRGDQ